MTKVLMHPGLLAYRQEMKDALRQVIQHNYIEGAPQLGLADPFQARLSLEDVLPPPEIELIDLYAYQGQDPDDDYIGAMIYHDFGIASINITILDEWGCVIESGEMTNFPDHPELWDYLPTVRVPEGTRVIVHVTAMDCMGGIGRGWERKTLGEEDW